MLESTHFINLRTLNGAPLKPVCISASRKAKSRNVQVLTDRHQSNHETELTQVFIQNVLQLQFTNFTLHDDHASLLSANMARLRPRLLIILDLNGTIIDRVKDRAEQKLARVNPHCPEPSFTSNAARIYIRPHLEPFLSVLFSNFTVAAWTSAQPKNAVPMARGVFGRHFDNLAFVWDRSHCSAVREGRKDHSSIKDVSKVWNYSLSHAASSITGLDGRANQVIHRRGDSRGSSDGGTLNNSRSQAPSKQDLWTPNNTILIDDTPYKASYTPHNILAIPTFSVRDSTIDPKQDNALLTVSNYLLELKRTLFDPANSTSSVDVREYLKRKPL
ncbi:hypothetical protein SeLEV6574_g00119 [Synchytrium endobioticum]|uniref:Mitochondrial import inner membrane translocase subunit TIM50 n=1 Tax=Synchytrium endobioticum TaxID=286115 RepID=A0A507DLD8_9FUNG|nr:hypothetical protein SeLEV6574_g00119 [Synchytrium endobioticum]